MSQVQALAQLTQKLKMPSFKKNDFDQMETIGCVDSVMGTDSYAEEPMTHQTNNTTNTS